MGVLVGQATVVSHVLFSAVVGHGNPPTAGSWMYRTCAHHGWTQCPHLLRIAWTCLDVCLHACADVRTRSEEPEPHVTLHWVQPAHAVITQSVAHTTTASVSGQLPSCVRVTAQLPPPPAGVATVRCRCLTPKPHDTEQPSHDRHDPTVQSLAHKSVLQTRDSERSGHPTPVLTVSVATPRERDVEPLPHVSEQAVQVDQP